MRLIDSAEETAADTRRDARGESTRPPPTARARYRFIASDDPQQFLTLGQRFLGAAIERVEVRTFG